MMEYTRVTVIGTRRKADLVLPDDHPLDQLLPEIVDLLDEPVGNGSPLILTSLLGQQVNTRATLAAQRIDHGAILRLVSQDEAPQPPDIADVTEAVSDAATRRADRWTPALTSLVLSSVVAVSAAITGLLLPASPGILTSLLVAFAVAIVVSALLARRGATGGHNALFGLSLGLAAPLGILGVPAIFPTIAGDLLIALVVSVVLGWVSVAAVMGVGARNRGVIPGAGVAAAFGVTAVAAALAGAPIAVTAAVCGIVAAVGIGLVPALALASAGVGRLDDTAMAGSPVRRGDIDDAIHVAFTAQTALALALTIPTSVAIVLLSTGDGWQAGLAAALALFLVARSRLFPLAVARTTLLIGALFPLGFWLLGGTMDPVLRAGIGAAVCVVLLVVALQRPSDAAQARLRRLLGVFEALTVIAMIPLLLGIIGVFGDLLGTFS
ncbi:EsaB/YukD family protein [Microbacterium sp. NPDC087665]|uniref:EsaB/YukD family protein n=1 Tax=Microbacterium sp. NPDC087665 TaxID=3364194 RepID=UPI003821C170